MMWIFSYLQLTLNRFFNNCVKLCWSWYWISYSWNIKGGGKIDPPPPHNPPPPSTPRKKQKKKLLPESPASLGLKENLNFCTVYKALSEAILRKATQNFINIFISGTIGNRSNTNLLFHGNALFNDYQHSDIYLSSRDNHYNR